jgi:hypothetical protein
MTFCEAEQRFLLLFLEKEEYCETNYLGGKSRNAEFGYGMTFCEAEQRFLLLFLEKEGYCETMIPW